MTGRQPFESLFVWATSALLIASGTGAGLSRYLPAIKPVVNVIPDVCVFAIVVLAIFAPRVDFKYTHAGKAAWLLITFCLLAAVPSVASMGIQAVYGLRSMIWCLVIALAIQITPLSAVSTQRIRTVLLVVLTANMIIALGQAITGLNAVELQSLIEAGSSYQVGSQTRLLGLQATGQELSMLAGSAFVWACAGIVLRGFKKVGFPTLVLGATAAVATLVVLQRSALIGALAAFAVLILGAGTGRLSGGGRAVRRIASIAGSAVLAIACLASLAPERVDLALVRFQSLFGLATDYSFSVRQDVTVPVALRLIGEQPFGYGLGASGPVASSFAPAGPLAQFPLGGIAADNGYLFVALQIGLPGLVAFLLLLVLWAWNGSFVPVTGRDRLAPRMVICFVAAIMLSGSFWGLTGAMAVIAILASVQPSKSAGGPVWSGPKRAGIVNGRVSGF